MVTKSLIEKKNHAIWNDVTHGNLKAIVATSPEEILAAQKLRYEVFYEEMGAIPSKETLAKKYDSDALDEYCDHLLVIDTEKNNTVVATYRLLRREKSKQLGYFYTASEYDISAIINYKGNILELGRSCVAQKYRTQPTVKLLWRGLGTYINFFDIDLLFGCASFTGTDVKEHATILSYLYHNHLAPKEIQPRTLEKYFVNMNILPKSSINNRKVFASLPPLIKAYLRTGGFIGNGAFIDTQFNTTDVCIVVKTDLIKGRYLRHYF